MPYHLETLLLSSALSRAAYFVVFLIVALRQPRELCLWHWIGAILASMVGSTIMAKVPTSRWLTAGEALAIYTFYAASLTLSWSGLRLFNGKHVSLPRVAAMAILPGIAYVAGLAAGLPMRLALAAVFVLCSAFAVLAAMEALSRTSGQRLWSGYIVSATFGFYSLSMLATLAVLIGTDIPMNSSQSAMLSLIVDQASGILVYFGYIAMAKERAVLTIEHIAETDPLTGLVNRRGLQAALERRRSKAPSQQLAGILLADIDHFKSINDAHGHDAGDAVLTAFALRLRAALRKDDIVARWGGEEFLAVLPQTEADLLALIAERLRQAIEVEPFVLPGGEVIAVTVSIGISEMPPNASHFEPATRRADAALYEAKNSGRNRICTAPFPWLASALAGSPA